MRGGPLNDTQECALERHALRAGDSEMKKRAGWRFAADGVSSSQGHRHAVVLSAGCRSLPTLLIREGQPPDSIAESHSAERGIVSILAHPPAA